LTAVSFAIGDRAPPIFGATADGRFYSLDAQAGRPAVLVALGAAGPDAARLALDQIRAAQSALEAAGVDMVPLASMGARFSSVFAGDAQAREQIVYLADGGGLERCEIGGSPAAIFIDRGGRILDIWPLDGRIDLKERLRSVTAAAASEAARRCTSSAPVLIIPNVASPACCEALIAHFEASPHTAGVMASYSGGVAGPKLDESKKRRRDMELTADAPLHGEVLDILAKRCAPEMKRAFQTDIVSADRILIARYDDSGGYFKRHRDNAAPHTAFREFAISINLNTLDYEGGELLFPEYDDHRYSPPAGSAIIFSASLLHEAAPVLRGRRYVLLSFLCSAAAQARAAPPQLVRSA
jgi:predicted 2-oxoglutarate/Fe(II)-dependent dioxygenase YbiX